MMGDGSPFWNPSIKADQFCSTRPMAKNSVLPPAVELQKPRLPPLPGLLRFKKGLKCEPPRRGCRGGRTRARRGGSRPPLLVSWVCGRSPIATATPPPSARNVAVAQSYPARPCTRGGSKASALRSMRRWLARSDLVNRVRRGAADCDGPATTDVLPPHISIPACDARKRVSTKPLREPRSRASPKAVERSHGAPRLPRGRQTIRDLQAGCSSGQGPIASAPHGCQACNR